MSPARILERKLEERRRRRSGLREAAIGHPVSGAQWRARSGSGSVAAESQTDREPRHMRPALLRRAILW